MSKVHNLVIKGPRNGKKFDETPDDSVINFNRAKTKERKKEKKRENVNLYKMYIYFT